MSVRPNRTHHRPAVRRLTGGLGTFRWVSACQCGHFATTTFWRQALIKAIAHSQELR